MPVPENEVYVASVNKIDLMRKKYFAMAKSFNHNANELKEYAKKKYNLSSFTEITEEQLSELITLLESKEVTKNNASRSK